MTAPALTDLDEVYDFIANDSDVAAQRFTTALLTDLYRVAEIGYTGVPRDHIRKGLRLHRYGSYCIYFRVDGDMLVVVRILHGSRDIGAVEFDSGESA